MIELRNLTKYYPTPKGRRYIVKNVSIEIPTGKNIAVVGPNGAGKSTLLRVIGGAEGPNSGEVLTDQNISWPLGLASGFQGSLTGRQNVEFICNLNGLIRAERIQVMDEIVKFTELDTYFDMPVNSYSSGMRARLTFGLSMVFKFDVYLVDELTSVGDMVFRQKAKDAFVELRNRSSIIFVSHNMNTLKESCDSALFLREGKATFYEEIDEGLEAYQTYMTSRGRDESEEDEG